MPRRRRGVLAPGLLLGGFAVLLLCWAFTNPPFASPDEWSHYLRAIGISSGHAIGDRPQAILPTNLPPALQRRFAWTVQASRVIHVPANTYAPSYELQCTSISPDTTAACLSAAQTIPVATTQITPVGNYQPVGYVASAALLRLGSGPMQDDRLGRIGSALLCLALLAVAAALLYDGGVLSLLGLALAATPMVLFCAASLNPSGLEICSGVAFAAAMLRLARGPGGAGVWAAAGVSGALLALSRSPGPLWVLIDTLTAIALVGPRGAWRTFRAGGAAAIAAAVAVAAAIVGNRLWENAYGSKIPIDAGEIVRALPGAIEHFPTIVYQLFGNFGALDSRLPTWGYVLAGVLFGAVIAAALALGRRRQGIVLVAVLAASVVITVLFYDAFTEGTVRYALQGRHVLPFAVLVPLLAGEILTSAARRRDAARWRRVLVGSFGAIALLQFAALYWNGRRQSVGAGGPLWFVPHAQWAPPLGWWPWLAIAAAGALCGALGAARRPLAG